MNKKIITFVLLTFSFMGWGKSLKELEERMAKAQTNTQMKIASGELNDAYKKEIKALSAKMLKAYTKETLKDFKVSQQKWQDYFNAEESFISNEYGQSDKYGTSGGLSRNIILGRVLRQRYSYLKKLEESLTK